MPYSKFLHPHFLAQGEELVNGIRAGKNDGGVIQDIDMCFSKIHRRCAIDLEKLVEVDINAILPYQFCVG